MRKNLILLVVTILISFFSVHAEALLTAEKGYSLSLTSSTENADRPNTEMHGGFSANRDKNLYVIGPFTNKTGKTQSIRLGLEFKELATGEYYYKTLAEEEEFVDGLQLLSASFYPNFVIRNGLYEVRAVYMDMSLDEMVTTNWESVAVPAGFTLPQVNITGDEPVAFFPSQPYVGTPNNVAERSDTDIHLTLTTLSPVEKGELFVFVFEPGIETSIGYYLVSFSQEAGVTKEYTTFYKKSGSHSANLEVGKTYELSFRFFENKKEQVFDWSYDGLKFSVVENGAGILDTFQDDVDATDARKNTGRKFMLEDGTLLIERNGLKFSISGAEMSE